MFTSEPSLAQRIERIIDATPIVDVRSRINSQRPAAADLASLMAEAPLRFALQGVGYYGNLADPARPEGERVAEVLPALRLVRNTAAGWCFHRILRDLYDFTDPELTTENLAPLLERVAQAGADPAWPDLVLRKRARLGQIVTGLPASDARAPVAPLVDSGLIAFRLDIAATDPGKADRETVRRSVFEQLDEQIEGPVRFASLVSLYDPSWNILDAVLKWHDLHEAPLQLAVTQPAAIGSAIAHYPRVRLCALASLADAKNLLELEDRSPDRANLAVGALLETGDGLGLIPSRLEAQTLDWIERFPAARIMGFASGMTTAEWTYGAYVLARRATAAALSRAVVGGYFEEDEIAPLCRAIFWDSPRRWHGLEG